MKDRRVRQLMQTRAESVQRRAETVQRGERVKQACKNNKQSLLQRERENNRKQIN